MKLSFILLLMALVSWPAMAEDTTTPQVDNVSSEPQTNKVQKSTKTVETKPRVKTSPKKQPSEREFDPSEEISEDLSVPFPVDI
ncbi:MAG: hypothetical protein JKY85_02530 [Porticoccus sp.]|nr:hypothetical protein [Porticoccus sp.]PCJ93644.1 MAG: hypothetical protein COA46_01000 [Porticoccaceae bacterium]